MKVSQAEEITEDCIALAESALKKIFNNIQKYGNTTAASIPNALTEAWEQGKVLPEKKIVLAAFGAGFTWGSVMINW